MQATHTAGAAYFHKVVDCQWACPAHTPVPEYIRLIAQGRYTDAYMVNWVSNVFPGILGRTCDRPCEPACRRGRVEENNAGTPEPVAICRLKRVAADHKDDVRGRMPAIAPRNGRRVACVGAGPSSLTVARDLAPHGCTANAVCPGFVWTPLWERLGTQLAAHDSVRHGGDAQAVFDGRVQSLVPMQRPQTGLDVAAMVAFLCSDAAANITGQVIGVDGGVTI